MANQMETFGLNPEFSNALIKLRSSDLVVQGMDTHDLRQAKEAEAELEARVGSPQNDVQWLDDSFTQSLTEKTIVKLKSPNVWHNCLESKDIVQASSASRRLRSPASILPVGGGLNTDLAESDEAIDKILHTDRVDSGEKGLGVNFKVSDSINDFVLMQNEDMKEIKMSKIENEIDEDILAYGSADTHEEAEAEAEEVSDPEDSESLQ